MYAMAAHFTGCVQVNSHCCRVVIGYPARQCIENSDWQYPQYSEIHMVQEKFTFFLLLSASLLSYLYS